MLDAVPTGSWRSATDLICNPRSKLAGLFAPTSRQLDNNLAKHQSLCNRLVVIALGFFEACCSLCAVSTRQPAAAPGLDMGVEAAPTLPRAPTCDVAARSSSFFMRMPLRPWWIQVTLQHAEISINLPQETGSD